MQWTGALSAALRERSRREDVTLFVLLLAAFQTLLFRYTRQEHIAVGTPIANRIRPEVEPLVGFFANTLVIDARLSSTMTFAARLDAVRATAFEAYANQDVPFEKLVETLRPERTGAHSPLFQVMFVLQNAPMPALELSGLTITPLHIDSGIARFDLLMNVVERDGRLDLILEYNVDLWDDETIARLLGHYREILGGVASSSDQTLSELPLLTTEEKQQLDTWSATALLADADTCCCALFEKHATRTPDAVAIVTENESLTYFALNQRANRLARALRAADLTPGTPIGLLLERRVDRAWASSAC